MLLPPIPHLSIMLFSSICTRILVMFCHLYASSFRISPFPSILVSSISAGQPSESIKKYPKYNAPIEEQEGIPRTWHPKEGIQMTSVIHRNSFDTPSTASSITGKEQRTPRQVRYWFLHLSKTCNKIVNVYPLFLPITCNAKQQLPL
ncbi:predicted protein [Lichtheimia corymbifera JMRC:FSU:9682]|uniref:Uncharacterized protein n=1 Tax=Lichtheimia corymbifera JMRC:FSU:9682 TaxID=1263082 RepID=A0A068RSX3_9FUNG|nr:predicted protein [Lichtheimia corymbifera JMRC:FSU:9682]